MSLSPPSYYAAGPAPASTLPSYSRRTNTHSRARSHAAVPRRLTEHVYHISETRPWLSLRVLSTAKSPDRFPSFIENETINGSVSIQLEREDSIQSLILSVHGCVIAGSGAHDSYEFYHHELRLWDKSMGNPRSSSPDSSATGHSRYKLSGDHTWPFAVELPRTVELPLGPEQPTEHFELPHNYTGHCSVQYSIAVRVNRSKMRLDSHLKTLFTYTPSTRPNPASALRQAAYQAQCPLPGPDMDPEGWRTCHPVKMTGSLFKTLPAKAEFTLSLANPLSYTRGTVIPCNLLIESEDRKTLDVLTAPSALVVSLRQRVRYHVAKKQTMSSEYEEDIVYAVWWPREQSGSLSQIRQLEGEIRLPIDLVPSSTLPNFTISYSVAICPSNHPAFTPYNDDALLTEPVEIATVHAKGPRPYMYAPPSYNKPTRPVTDRDALAVTSAFYGANLWGASRTT